MSIRPPLPAALVRRGTLACFVVKDFRGQKLAASISRRNPAGSQRPIN